VGADAAVLLLAPVAVHAQHLETGRIAVVAEPPIDLLAAASRQSDFLAVTRSVVVDVIEAQEERFGFSAAVAGVAAIRGECCVFQLPIVGAVCCTRPFQVVAIPLPRRFVGLAGMAGLLSRGCCPLQRIASIAVNLEQLGAPA